MKFWKDVFVFTVGESLLAAIVLKILIGNNDIHQIFPGLADVHRLYTVLIVLFGFFFLCALQFALGNSINRSNKKYKEYRIQQRQEELIGYGVERSQNHSSSNLHNLTIETYVPSKWRFVDLESNVTWKWENDKFVEDVDA